MYRPVACYPDQLPKSIIHQKNSYPLVITGFEGFHGMFNYIKVKGGVTCDTNRESPCSTLADLYTKIAGLRGISAWIG